MVTNPPKKYKERNISVRSGELNTHADELFLRERGRGSGGERIKRGET